MLGPVPIEPPANLPVPKTISIAPVPGTPNPSPPPSNVPSTLSVLEYTGIPKSVLTWKPRLPSRNWSIFFSIVIGSGSLYYYDRRECARLKQEYTDKVKHLAEEKMGSVLEYPRLVKVYAAKWPEDDDYDRGLLYFRKYVKPVLIAAGVDYDLITSPQHGALSRHLLATTNLSRRRSLGLEPPANPIPLPYQLTPEQELERDVRGGVVLVGRHSLKEYLEGLRRGWMDGEGSQGVRRYDMEGKLKAELEQEERNGEGPLKAASATKSEESGPEFLEEQAMQDLETEETISLTPPQPSPTPTSTHGLGSLGFLSKTSQPITHPSMFPSHPAVPTAPIDPDTLIPSHLHLTPNPLPPTPPILLVPWTNHLGFLQLPYMFLGLFNERKLVREGGEAGLKIVLGGVRDFTGREVGRGGVGDNVIFSPSDETIGSSASGNGKPASDLDFDIGAETYYKNDFEKLPKRIADAKTKYYSTFSTRVTTARDLAAAAREPTKEEIARPPMKEDELKAERLEKELRWKRDLEGWELVKKGSEVPWDERWRGWLKVYEDPVMDRSEGSSPW